MTPKFDTRISIEYKSVTQDASFGTEVIQWVRLGGAPMWAEVLDSLPGRNEAVLQGDLEVSRNTARVRLRYRSDVTSAMRVVVHRDADAIYAIVGGPTMIGRKKYLELLCERQSTV